MASETPSYFSIQALEDTRIVAINYQKWRELFHETPEWQTFRLALLEKGFAKKEKREREFLLLDAAERYQSFLQEYPGLEGRIQQHLIASYLGITPVALSRIRSKIHALT
jgi:CRP-like cAMP-binding protein